MEPDSIVINGARQHNLKNVSLSIPKKKFVVFTGPSGSGKSSLAFDTLYAEGQRRYIESLNAYARQFLGQMDKPLYDSIRGLAPTISIEQKAASANPRSTVGTVTEIHDYLRVFFARVGHLSCPKCGRDVKPQSSQQIVAEIASLKEGKKFLVLAPIVDGRKGEHHDVFDTIRKTGFTRARVDGAVVALEDDIRLDKKRKHSIEAVVDRLIAKPDLDRTRLADSVEQSLKLGKGVVIVAVEGEPDRVMSQQRACANCNLSFPEPTPQLFSFNSPRGACPECNGFGAILEYDVKLIVPYPQRSLRDGAIDPWTKPRYENKRRTLAEYAKKEGIPMDAPWQELSERQHERLLNANVRGYKGILPFLRELEDKRYKQYIRVFLRQYQTAQECPTCHGTKLQRASLQVRIAGRNIAEVSDLPVGTLAAWLDTLELSEFDRQVAAHILGEARDRVRFLCDVGLNYLSLNRATRTLSGGEAQRIGLANSLGSRLVDTLYVLDEPSIGLHSRDMDRLLKLLLRLRDGGNTVLVVEHDLDAIRAADYMIELGPHSGEKGGELVFAGPMSRVSESPLTGQYLTGERTIPLPVSRRRIGPQWLALSGAREHNLKNVDVRIPLGTVTAVTGVSGSGKSTLIHDVLMRALETKLTGEHSAKQHLGERVGDFDSLTGYESLDDVVLVDQSPIGKSPRSNPVTYVKAFDEVRRIFAALPAARQRGYTAGTFSFNVAGGRCETCEGAGYLEVEMVFMADVFVPCDDCVGRRFKPEVLEIKYLGKSVTDVLDMTVDEAIRFFPYEEKLGQALWQLQQVGLGYLRLGQPATTLSGGEAQRLKVARELVFGSRKSGRKLYIMDEPTTGLHLEDIRRLALVFDRLVDAGHTLVLIEHNLDVIKLADWVIDLGPEAGDAGGEIVAVGRPEEVAAVAASHTGRWLRSVLPDWDQPSGLSRAAHGGKPRTADLVSRRRARAS